MQFTANIPTVIIILFIKRGISGIYFRSEVHNTFLNQPVMFIFCAYLVLLERAILQHYWLLSDDLLGCVGTAVVVELLRFILIVITLTHFPVTVSHDHSATQPC